MEMTVDVPRQVREALNTLEQKTGGVPGPLVADIERLYQRRQEIKASEYAADKEARLLKELDEKWAADLETFVTAESQRAAAERDKELAAIATDERAANAPPSKRPTETDGEYLGRSIAALHARQAHSDHLRVAALDVSFAEGETDPGQLAALLTTALSSNHTERITLTSRVIERRLRALAEHETRTDAPQRPASAALARVSKQITDWRAATDGSTPDARRASAMQRFQGAVTQAAQRVSYVKDLVGLGTKRPGL